MKFFKKLAGIIVFVAALAGAVVLTKYYGRPEPSRAETDSPAPREANVNTSATPATAAPVTFKPQLITLDFAGKKSHTTVVLERDPTGPAPRMVWVWTYFFKADGERKYCAAEPVEARWPSAESRSERITVEAPAASCAEPRDASTSFYARVNVSTESAFAARLSESKISYDLTSATPVVVKGVTRKSRAGR